jgi:hypothetical protein
VDRPLFGHDLLHGIHDRHECAQLPDGKGHGKRHHELKAFQDKLNQQKFNNDVTSQKLNIALGEWNLKKSNAAQKASRAGSTAAGSKTGGTGTGSTSSGTANRSTGTATRLGSDTSRNVTVPYMAMLMRSQGKSDTSISTALRQDGYSSAEIAQILQQMRR